MRVQKSWDQIRSASLKDHSSSYLETRLARADVDTQMRRQVSEARGEGSVKGSVKMGSGGTWELF